MGSRGGVTMHNVARVAGVSVMTVSNVINGYRYVRPQTKQRVEAAIQQLGYRVNQTARNLRLGRTGVIGLVLPESTVSYFAESVGAIIGAADEVGLTVLIEQAGATKEQELSMLAGARRDLTDGLIFYPAALDQKNIDALNVPYPMVLVGSQIFGGPVDHVTMNDVGGAQAATEHLAACGRRRIALLGKRHRHSTGTTHLRLQGYKQGLEAAGIAYDPQIVIEAEPWHRRNGAQAICELLDSGQQFDAVVAMNDAMALGALHVLNERRIRVPDEVAVIGFDNTDSASYSVPTLSSIDPHHTQIAATAVHLLKQRIDNPSDRPPVSVIPDFTIVERQSTGHLV